ncbi:MAG: radical SAM protein [Parachlamydiaceae bacterium]|nr:radical SAM protein [Parachlamydiaceae bacterium]
MKSLTIILTDKCNLSCSYCYLSEKGEKRYIDNQTLSRVIYWFFQQCIQVDEKKINIVFFGGEPLIAFPRLKFAVEFAKNLAKRFSVEISFLTITNGTLVNEEILDFFIENKVVLQLSIDGEKDSHNEHRTTKSNKGSHNSIKFIENIKKYLNKGLKVSANMVYTSHTAHKLYKNYLYLQSLGFKSIRLRPVTGCFDEWDEHILKEQINLILNDWANKDDIKLYPISNYFEHQKRTSSFDELDNEVVCNLASLQFTVDMNGDLFPCHRFRYHQDYMSFNFGNIIHNTIDKEKIKNFLDSRPRRDGGCSKCPFKYFCDVQCVYAFYEKNKNLNTPDPQLCLVSKSIWETFLEFMNQYSSHSSKNYLNPSLISIGTINGI